MVGPSLSEDDRQTAGRRLAAGFVSLVGASGGLVALQAGASTTQLVAATAGALVVGLLLAALLRRLGAEFSQV